MIPPRLHGFLLDSADKAPEHLAYVQGDATTTYAELAGTASRLAWAMRRAGVERGDRVALVLDGRVEYLAAYYGILMAGGVVVPMNPDTRPRVLAHALSHCDARAVVIGGGELPHLAKALDELPGLRLVVSVGEARGDLGAHGVELAPFDALVAGADELPDGGASGEDLASINYTSGTTGPPKGVMLAHRNLVANVRSIVRYLELDRDDRIAMVLPYYYVYGNSVLHTHLAAAGTVVNVGTMAFPARVLEGIEAHRCTGISGVPSTFARLTRFEGLERYDLDSLRYVTQAGAAMNRTLTAALRRSLPTARIFVMYGQTEASARLSYLPPEQLDRKMGSAGKAIPDVELSIADADGNPVSSGTVGEIVARGDNIMLGYLDDPEATARALRGGVLHTGDIARMDEDGYLFIVGRESDMIKSGGHRIGPHEIEEVIAAIDGVAECAVVGVTDDLLGQAIAVFIVQRSGAALDERQVKKACFADLPRYKMPTHVQFIDALPRSDRGKLLRSALRERFEGGPQEGAG